MTKAGESCLQTWRLWGEFFDLTGQHWNLHKILNISLVKSINQDSYRNFYNCSYNLPVSYHAIIYENTSLTAELIAPHSSRDGKLLRRVNCTRFGTSHKKSSHDQNLIFRPTEELKYGLCFPSTFKLRILGSSYCNVIK